MRIRKCVLTGVAISCLLGVATPSDLIQDTRTTPFNIGRRIELTAREFKLTLKPDRRIRRGGGGKSAGYR